MPTSASPERLRFHRYELEPLRGLGSRAGATPREGALLEVSQADGSRGYADCHPWPELGDKPLAEQLAGLKRSALTALTARSLHYARVDARLRAAGESAWKGLKIPESHALLTDPAELTAARLEELAEEGFRRAKLKLGRNPAAEADALVSALAGFPAERTDFRLRLDFNDAASAAGITALLERLEGFPGVIQGRLDFLEDPFPFDPAEWGTLQTRFGVAFALDRNAEPWVGKTDLAPVWVIKPAIQDPDRFMAAFESLYHPPVQPRLVFTSYLDHPLGQATAAYEAARQLAQLGLDEICGLLSHRAYAPNAFSEQLASRGPRFRTPEGTGFGFDRLLEDLDWSDL